MQMILRKKSKGKKKKKKKRSESESAPSTLAFKIIYPGTDFVTRNNLKCYTIPMIPFIHCQVTDRRFFFFLYDSYEKVVMRKFLFYTAQVYKSKNFSYMRRRAKSRTIFFLSRRFRLTDSRVIDVL